MNNYKKLQTISIRIKGYVHIGALSPKRYFPLCQQAMLQVFLQMDYANLNLICEMREKIRNFSTEPTTG